jgi:hypothetical protein
MVEFIDCPGGRAETANEETDMSESIETFPERAQIEERAYEIFLERGGTHGDDLADWLTAEEELKALAQRPADDATVDDGQMARVRELLRELYERSRAIAASAGG